MNLNIRDIFDRNDSDRVVKLPVKDIYPSRYQPRLRFDETALNELTDSIREARRQPRKTWLQCWKRSFMEWICSSPMDLRTTTTSITITTITITRSIHERGTRKQLVCPSDLCEGDRAADPE